MRKRANAFYSIFVITIILIRIGVFLFPLNKIIIGGLRINHFWIGLAFFLIVGLLAKRYNLLRMILFSIGLGIVSDELFFMIFSNRTIDDYWSIYSVSGLIIIMIIVFISRKKLVDKIYKL